MSDQNEFGNALPRNPAEQQAQQDYVESLLAGKNAQEEAEAQANARRLEGQRGL